MPIAKLKQHPKAGQSTARFTFETLPNSSIRINLAENQFSIISQQEFDTQFEAVEEAVKAEQPQ